MAVLRELPQAAPSSPRNNVSPWTCVCIPYLTVICNVLIENFTLFQPYNLHQTHKLHTCSTTEDSTGSQDDEHAP